MERWRELVGVLFRYMEERWLNVVGLHGALQRMTPVHAATGVGWAVA